MEDEYAALAMTIAPKAERVRIMADMLTGLTKLPTAKYNLWVETGNAIPRWMRGEADIMVRRTNGSVLTLELCRIRLYPTMPTITVTHDGVDTMYENPMDALVAMHAAFQR